MFSENDYPAPYRDADSASLHAQTAYLRLQRIYLGSLVSVSALGTVASLQGTTVSLWLNQTIAIFLVAGLLVLWIMRFRQDDLLWFDGRAVAESIKTAAWRYMMRIPPYADDVQADVLFAAQLRDIRAARPQLLSRIAGHLDGDGQTITASMRDRRLGALDARRDFYVTERLRSQKLWYSNKAKSNVRASSQLFWTIVTIQFSATVLAILNASWSGVMTGIVPLMITSAAVLTAWSQLKRYNDLAQSYAMAAQELGELEALAGNQRDTQAFAQLVEQVEESISREHTMWCARRDVSLAGRKP